MATTQIVSWETYAQTYDMLMFYNPFYQQLHKEVMEHVQKWQIAEGGKIADLGAGTGNYSLAMAETFPHAQIIHVDNDEGMNAQTALKKEQRAIYNHSIMTESIHDLHMEDESLDALVSIHALYTFPDPQKALKDMYNWLKPGGQAVLVNAGRIVNILNWQLAIGLHLIRNHGFKKTLEILSKGKEVSKQNAYIREMQKDGTYWTHTHEEFLDAVLEAGFEIQVAKTAFRGISDLVVVKKMV